MAGRAKENFPRGSLRYTYLSIYIYTLGLKTWRIRKVDQ